jgi:opacity protein-like surface antigen
MNKNKLLKSLIAASIVFSAFSSLADYSSGFYTRFSFAGSSLVKKNKLPDTSDNVYAQRKSNSAVYGLGFGLNIGGGFLGELMLYKNQIVTLGNVTSGVYAGPYSSPGVLPSSGTPADYKPLSWNALTPMFQVYYEMVRLGPISPYVMMGAGLSRQVLQGNAPTTGVSSTNSGPINIISSTGFKVKKTSVSYSVGAGLNMLLSDSFDLDVSYKMTALGKMQTSRVLGNNNSINLTKAKYHVIELGFKYWF